jgi:hypothetical protein
MTTDDNDKIRGAILARIFSAAAQPTEADQVRAMDKTIREMAQDRYTNPQRLVPEARMQREGVKPVGATPVKTWGWAPEKKIESPSAKGSPTDQIIGGLADKFLGAATPGKPDENK